MSYSLSKPETREVDLLDLRGLMFTKYFWTQTIGITCSNFENGHRSQYNRKKYSVGCFLNVCLSHQLSNEFEVGKFTVMAQVEGCEREEGAQNWCSHFLFFFFLGWGGGVAWVNVHSLDNLIIMYTRLMT